MRPFLPAFSKRLSKKQWVSGIGCWIFGNSHHVDATVINWLGGPPEHLEHLQPGFSSSNAVEDPLSLGVILISSKLLLVG